MKTVYLFRHAKSSWDDPDVDDFDRALNERGEKAAPLMGEAMKEREVRPDVILCSPARRAVQTATLALQSASIEIEPCFDERIYLASAPTLLSILSERNDKVDSVLMIGHNPGMSDLLEMLTGKYDELPTAALARINLDIKKWRDLKRGCGKLDWVLRPKELA